MRIYIGFDDTDIVGADRGTGKLARRFDRLLPKECSVWGVVRQQLLVDPAIPHTPHNSSACVVVDCAESFNEGVLLKQAIDYLEKRRFPAAIRGFAWYAPIIRH